MGIVITNHARGHGHEPVILLPAPVQLDLHSIAIQRRAPLALARPAYHQKQHDSRDQFTTGTTANATFFLCPVSWITRLTPSATAMSTRKKIPAAPQCPP